MQTLKRISEDKVAIYQKLEDNGGELTPELEEELTINQKNLKEKTVAYIEVLKALNNGISRYDEEIKRLTALKKRALHLYAFLENNLKTAVQAFGPIKTDFNRVSLGNTKACIILDEEAVPAAYKKVTTSETVDKIALKKDLEDGKIAPTDKYYVQENQHLLIS